MPQFFIHRPVFAWVIALFIVLLGVLAIPQLPISRYPTVAPPTVSLYATYPGATPKTLNDSVVSLIERELSSVRHLLYFESSVDTSGSKYSRSEEHTSELQSHSDLVCRLLLEKKKDRPKID